jgi:Tfp pilus assembly protein PilX
MSMKGVPKVIASHRSQRGAAALIVTALLLFASSIVIFYLHRGLLLEQKMSANHARASTAFEMAEAGIEWATGMLNSAYHIQADCTFQSAAPSGFRKQYVQTQLGAAAAATSDIVPAVNVFPGCKVSGTTLDCSCPDVPTSGTATASLGTTTAPGFTVAFAAVAGDAESVQVTSTGCTAQAGACTAGTTGNTDANATVSVILKMRPKIRAVPAAALTCGSSCNAAGSYSIVNTDLSTGGIVVDAGTTIAVGAGTSLVTLPGLAPANALIANDSSLSALSNADPTCSDSSIFQAHFGSTVAQYAAAPGTRSISCASASDCAAQVEAAFAAGWRAFFFSPANVPGLQLGSLSGSLGTQADPVTVVAPSGFKVDGNITIHGLIFSNDSNVNDTGIGNANVHGAVVTCGAFSSSGSGTIQYDALALQNARRSTAVLVRVPGSWRDF